MVLGHAAYYPKAGYIPAGFYGIKPPFAVDNDNFMAICFKKTARKLNGVIRYDEAFGI
ncbi:MAG: hypothetical protein HFG49_12740 [Lachnospiraceae bacterium]|nr:hypothetical protein [Lachnospiraceae bacterium]